MAENEYKKWDLTANANHNPEMTPARIFVLLFFIKNPKTAYSKGEIVSGIEEILNGKATHLEISKITHPILTSVTFKRMIDPLCQTGYVKKEGRTSTTKYSIASKELIEAYLVFENTRKKIVGEMKLRGAFKMTRQGNHDEEEKQKGGVISDGKL